MVLLIDSLGQISDFKGISLKVHLSWFLILPSEALQAHLSHYDLLSATLCPRFDNALCTECPYVTLHPRRCLLRLSIGVMMVPWLVINKKHFVAWATNNDILLLNLRLLYVRLALCLKEGIFIFSWHNTWLIMLRVRIFILVSFSGLGRHGMLIVRSQLLGSPVVNGEHCMRRESVVTHGQKVGMLGWSLRCQIVLGWA